MYLCYKRAVCCYIALQYQIPKYVKIPILIFGRIIGTHI